MELELSRAGDARPNEPCEICRRPVPEPWSLAMADVVTETQLYGHHACLADVQKARGRRTIEEQTT
jgi:hypothetical protein